MNEARWISVEGIDGCGKSTLIANLIPFFEERNINVKVISMFQKGLLRDAILHQPTVDPLQELLISRALHAETHKVIEDSLAKGITVITDRGIDSFYAYPDPSVVTPEKFELLDKLYPFPRMPDITLLVSIDPDIAQQRMLRRGQGFDEIEKRGRDFQTRVSKVLHKRIMHDYEDRKHCYPIGGDFSQKEMTAQARAVLSFYFPTLQ